jgi:hypothetical protein
VGLVFGPWRSETRREAYSAAVAAGMPEMKVFIASGTESEAVVRYFEEMGLPSSIAALVTEIGLSPSIAAVRAKQEEADNEQATRPE